MKECWPVLVFIRAPILALICFGFWGLGASNGSVMEWLERWQGLIGSVVAVIAAISLFQIQRYKDRTDAITSRTQITETVLKQIRNSVNEGYFSEKASKYIRDATEIREETQLSPFVGVDLGKIQSDIRNLAKHCERYIAELKTIPRDQFLPEHLKKHVLWLESSLLGFIEAIELISINMERNSSQKLVVAKFFEHYAEQLPKLQEIIQSTPKE